MFDSETRREIGGLETLFIPGKADGPYIVLIHGFGANMADLYSLHRILPDHPEVNWVFPNGFIDVPFGLMMSGRAWFPIDMDDFAQRMWSEQQSELSEQRPPGLDEANTRLQKLLDGLGVPRSQVVLGGFSQGGALATDLALLGDEAPAGLAILSSMLVDRSQWDAKASARKGLRVFQSHGRQDPLVSVEPAKELHDLFHRKGLNSSLHLFDGGHEIPPHIITHLATFLQGCVAAIER
jgi:phospholipase/carboxylesterase